MGKTVHPRVAGNSGRGTAPKKGECWRPPGEQREWLPVSFAGRLGARIRGLLAQKPTGRALVLMPCRDVHTVGMRHRLDVAFVDASGRVLSVHRDIGPFRRLRHRQAVAVLERFSSCSTPWFRPGDQVGISGMRGDKR